VKLIIVYSVRLVVPVAQIIVVQLPPVLLHMSAELHFQQDAIVYNKHIDPHLPCVSGICPVAWHQPAKSRVLSRGDVLWHVARRDSGFFVVAYRAEPDSDNQKRHKKHSNCKANRLH
jgi:hypothetical protein